MPEELGTLFPLLLGLSVPITVSFGFYFYFLSHLLEAGGLFRIKWRIYEATKDWRLDHNKAR